MIYQSFMHKWFANPIFLLCYRSIITHSPVLYQLITNDLLMQFLCIIIAYCLPIICQLIIIICCTNVLPVIANLTQCFTYPIYQWLSIICQFIITNHSIGNFLPIGSQCFTNHQFTNGTGKFTNSCQWFTIGSCWQWYMGGCLTDKIR